MIDSIHLCLHCQLPRRLTVRLYSLWHLWNGQSDKTVPLSVYSPRGDILIIMFFIPSNLAWLVWQLVFERFN